MSNYPTTVGTDVNPLLNGMMQHWTDATTINSDGGKAGVVYTLGLGTGGSPAATWSRQAFTLGQTAVPGEPEFFGRWAQTAVATTTAPTLENRIENVRTLNNPAGGQNGRIVRLTGWYRADKDMTVALVQNFGSGGSPSSAVVSATEPLPNTVDSTGTALWKRFRADLLLASLSGKTIGSTANTSYLAVRFIGRINVTHQVDLVDLKLTGADLPHIGGRRNEEEEFLLQRYYRGSIAAAGSATATMLTPTMRVTPTASGTGWVATAADRVTIGTATGTLDARL